MKLIKDLLFNYELTISPSLAGNSCGCSPAGSPCTPPVVCSSLPSLAPSGGRFHRCGSEFVFSRRLEPFRIVANYPTNQSQPSCGGLWGGYRTGEVSVGSWSKSYSSRTILHKVYSSREIKIETTSKLEGCGYFPFIDLVMSNRTNIYQVHRTAKGTGERSEFSFCKM